jgi:hypothetical protein
MVSFSDFSEFPADELLPWLDRRDVDEAALTPHQAAWRRDGVLILPGFIPDDVTGPYIERRAANKNPAGWLTPTSYMHILELRDLGLYPPLMAEMKALFGADMSLQMCLTGWISSERNWHQDDYLNPDFLNTWYAAVWVALDDIHPDSGPFEYVPGSHHWPLMRGALVKQLLPEDERGRRSEHTGAELWASATQDITTPAIEAEIAARGAEILPFIAKRGDVLIWHSRLMHRGAPPKVAMMERRAVILHYSAAVKRPDMTHARDQNGEFYAVFDTPLVGG